MPGENGGRGAPGWVNIIGSLVAIAAVGGTVGGIAGYEKAQGVTEAQRLWFEQRLAAVQGTVKEEKAEIRSNLQEEWDSFEARVIRALDRKVDEDRIIDQMTEMRRRIEELEKQSYGREGGAR